MPLSSSLGLALEGEEGKRQGLIPFPRVGRTMNPWIPVLYHSDLDDVEDKRQVMVPYPRIGRTSLSPWMTSAYQPSDLDDKQEFNIPDDLLTVRYTRGGLFTPRLGRRKRSTDDMTENSRDSMMDNTSLSGKSKQLGDLLRRTSWAIVAYKGNYLFLKKPALPG